VKGIAEQRKVKDKGIQSQDAGSEICKFGAGLRQLPTASLLPVLTALAGKVLQSVVSVRPFVSTLTFQLPGL